MLHFFRLLSIPTYTFDKILMLAMCITIATQVMEGQTIFNIMGKQQRFKDDADTGSR